jgi:HD-GYP domain-containing protein (c-di-GMP phosphodiesterase class II)
MATSRRVPLALLRPGVAITEAIADPNWPRVRLLGAGVKMTQAFIDGLRRRGVTSIIMASHDIAILRAFTPQGRRTKVPPAHPYSQSAKINDYTAQFDDSLKDQPTPKLEPSEHPFAGQIETPVDCTYADGLPTEWATKNNDQVDSVCEFYQATVDRRTCDVGPLFAAVQAIVEHIAEDKDALVCLASTPYDSDYPSRHGLHLASVAMSIGVELGLDEPQLIDLGMGCLIHDVGMQSVGLRLFENKSTLSPIQLDCLADHPVEALEIACEYGANVSEASKLVAYQIHERGDGSGYPRGWTADRIHPLAKIAGVADTYVGMLTDRRHRVAIQGYHVILHLLSEMRARKFDPHVIRALINACSLYPLGSMVSLNNECVGRVIRSGGDRFVEPTIEMWHADHCDREPVIINLRHEPTIRITGSISADRMPLLRAA